MKTLVCVDPGRLELVERPLPVRGAQDVLLRIRRVGICGTDMHIFAGQHPYLAYPRVMGHELGAEVAEAPSGSTLAIGGRVYVNPYLSCGKCHACLRAKPNCCMNIAVLGVHCDGGMAEYLAVPAKNVFSAGSLSLDEAAMVEFLAIGAHAVRRARIQPGDRVLVVGAGPIGLGTGIFAGLDGGLVTALDMRGDRLDFFTGAVPGSEAVLSGPDVAAELAARTGGNMFDVVFDATGHAGSMEAAFAYVAHGGTCVLVSVVKNSISFSDPEFHKREMTLVGSRNATDVDFDRVVQAMLTGKVPSASLKTHAAPMADLQGVLPQWLRPETKVVKAMVEL